MMKRSIDAKAMAGTALASVAVLLTFASTNIGANQQILAGSWHYGYGRGYEQLARPGYPYYPPGRQSKTGVHSQPPAGTHAADSVASAAKTASRSANVTIAGMQFHPPTIRIKAGDEVTWINNEPILHAVSSPDNGLLASERLGLGSVFTHKFEQSGVYTYYCAMLPSMRGVVIVE
jgi:plastocyanin